MTIYVLKCESDKYFVVETSLKKDDVITYYTLNGGEWTQKYKPIQIIDEYNGNDFNEEEYTIVIMEKYGIYNVRGNPYCKIGLSDYDYNNINDDIYSLQILREI